MKNLLRYFCSNTFLVNLISIFLVIAGAITLSLLHTDMMPTVTRPTVSISGIMRGAAPTQIERYAVRRLEDSISSIPNVELVTTNIYQGRFNIDLEFNASHTDLLSSKDEVETAVASVEYSLPESLEDLKVEKGNSRRSGWMGSLNIMGLSPDSPDAQLITDRVMDSVLDVKGIIETNSELDRKKLIVSLDAQKLENTGLKSEQIINLLKSFSSPKYGGTLKKNSDSISIEIDDPELSLERLSQMPLITNSYGKTFELKDVASFKWRYSESPTLRRLNGQVYTRFWIFKDMNYDILDLEDKVKEQIASVNETILKDTEYKLEASRLASQYVSHQIDTLKNNALIGLCLVILVLGFFLGIRTAIITAFSVPLAYATAMIGFAILGLTINIVSLLALILVLGLLVDDAIIVAEKYVQNREKGDPPFDAALNSANQLLTPVTATIATSAIAFLPILGVQGFFKEIFLSIPIVVCATLFASWFESFFILPNHLKDFLTKPPKQRAVMDKLKGVYKSTLYFSIKHRYLVCFLLLLVAAASVWLGTQKINSRFHLRFGSESIEVTTILKDSPSLEYTEKYLRPMEEYLLDLKKKDERIEEVSFRIGRVWLERQRKEHPRYAEFDIDLKSSSTSSDEDKAFFQEKIKEYIKTYPNKELFERLSVSTRNARSNANLDSTVSVYFSGKRSDEFDQLKAFTQKEAEKLDNFLSFSYDEDVLTKSWVFEPSLPMLNSLGLDTSDLSTQLGLYTENRFVSDTFFGDDEVSIYASMGDLVDEPEFSKLNGIKILTDQNIPVAITSLGRWKESESFSQIFREDLERVIRFDVQFDENKTDVVKFQNQIDTVLIPELKEKFQNYKVTSKLANTEAEENKDSIKEVAVLCIVGILFILALQLGSLTQPLLVASVIPFGAFGALWALYTHGLDLGLMAMVGLLGVAGVAVNDSIVLVDEANIQKKKLGSTDSEYIYVAAVSRLRAIILTTVTTLGGLFPMAYGLGGDSALTRPLAFAMAWGLLGSTLLTLIALPCFLAVRDDIERKFKSIFNIQ